MVAYSFNKRFIAPILTGAKRQTLRSVGLRRHGRPGETLQLYTGMRTKHCRLIAKARCENVARILLDLEDGRVEFMSGTAITTIEDLDHFATLDGFPAWRDLMAFWAKEHPGVPRWEGLRITWGRELEVLV